MRELRKQALESHKKTSRKAQNKASQSVSLTASPARTPGGSRIGSTLVSPAMSRVGSRVGSRDATDAEDSSEDGSVMSDHFSSMEDQMSLDEAATWEDLLKDRIQEIIEWKRSSTEGREKALRQYVRILQQRYAVEEISGQEQDLIISVLRSIKQAASNLEVELALKALELTQITSGLETVYEDCAPRVKRTIEEEDTPEHIRVLAIRTYAILVVFSGVEDEGIIPIMDFLLDIIATDGESISAENLAGPVTAALEAYSLLATFVEDLSDYSADHIDTIMDQFDSSFASVQVAAGKAVALLFEKSYTPPEAEEDIGSLDQNSVVVASTPQGDKPALIRRYQATTSYNEIINKLEAMSSHVGRAKRKDIKAARKSFEYILSSIQNPTYGPMYSTAVDEDERAYGSRFKIKVGATSVITINKWWKLFRVTSLRQCLQSGFLMHYQENPLLFEMTSVVVDPVSRK